MAGRPGPKLHDMVSERAFGEGSGPATKEVRWTMQSIVVLVAIFVLSFIAGFGWYTGAGAARVIARVLKRDSPRGPAKERGRVEPSRVTGPEADEPVV